MNWHLLAFIIALAISYVGTPLIRRVAIKLRVMVDPGGRRVHTRPMPLWGGIAIYGAFALTCLVVGELAGSGIGIAAPMRGVLLAGVLLLTVGMMDDMKDLSAGVQALAIVLGGVLLILFGVKIQFLTNPFSRGSMIALGATMSWIVTLVWVFGVTKTVDLMDGLDGLAAGIGAIAAGVLAIMAYYSSQAQVALMGAALCGACVGFLRFNFSPAKIFMGTGGSQFIGFVLAAISIIGAFKMAAAIAIALPILVFGVPIFDAAFVVLKRVVNRRPVHVADRTHLHHRLLDRGLSQKQAVLVIYVISLLFGGTALALYWLSR